MVLGERLQRSVLGALSRGCGIVVPRADVVFVRHGLLESVRTGQAVGAYGIPAALLPTRHIRLA